MRPGWGFLFANRLLAGSCWLLLALIILGVLSFAVRGDAQQAYGTGGVPAAVRDTLSMLGGLSAMISWIAAVWRAIVDPVRRSLPKLLLVPILVVSSGIGALLYYWLFVFWLSGSATARPPDTSLS